MQSFSESNKENKALIQTLTALPICPLCRGDLIVLESIHYSHSNTDPLLEFSCSCLQPNNENNSQIPSKAQITVKEYLNFISENIIKGNVVKCFKHNNRNGVIYCVNCDLNMCSCCYSYHKSFKSTHNTKYAFGINEIKCIYHKEHNCSFYCSNCARYICDLCKSLHNNHKINTLNDFWEVVYTNLGIKSIDELTQFFSSQSGLLNNFVTKQIGKIDQIIKQLEKIKIKFSENYLRVNILNENLILFYQLMLNNFINSKMTPKVAIMQNMEKVNFDFFNNIDNNLIIKLNFELKEIANHIKNYSSSLFDSFKGVKFNKDDSYHSTNTHSYNSQSLCFQKIVNNNPPIIISNDNKEKNINCQIQNLNHVTINPTNLKLSPKKENICNNSISSHAFLGHKKEKSTSDTSSPAKENSIHLNPFVPIPRFNNKVHSLSPTIITNTSFSIVQGNVDNIYLNQESNRNNNLLGIKKRKVEINIANATNNMTKFTKCVKEIVNENQIPSSFAVYPINDIYYLFIACDDKTIKVYNLQTYQYEKNIKTSPNFAMYFSFSLLNHKEFVYSVNDNTLKIYNAVDWTHSTKIFFGHTKKITEILIFPNNNFFASASKDKTIKIWDVRNEKCIKTLKGHTESILAMVLSKEKKIISGGGDCVLKVWDIKDEKCIADLKGHNSGIISLNTNKITNLIVSASTDETIRIWDIGKEQCLFTFGLDLQGITSAIWIGSDIIITTSNKGDLRFLYIKNNAGIECFGVKELAHNKSINRMITYNDENFLVSGGEDQTIKIWVSTLSSMK